MSLHDLLAQDIRLVGARGLSMLNTLTLLHPSLDGHGHHYLLMPSQFSPSVYAPLALFLARFGQKVLSLVLLPPKHMGQG